MATSQNQANGNSNSMTNGQALGNIDKLADEAGKVVAGAGTALAVKVLPRVAHSLLVSSIMQAGASFKSAINMEVAVCLTVFANARAANLTAKKELYGIYKEAGYDCEVGGTGKDYKTVNRRIGYAAQFFGSLKEGTVEEWMGDETRDNAALQSVVNRLAVAYNFRSMNDVQAASGVVPVARQPRQSPAKGPQAPDGGTGTQAGPQGGQGPSGGSATQEPVKAVTATDQKTIDAAKVRFDKGDAPTVRQASVLAKYGINLETAKQPDTGDKGVLDALKVTGAARLAEQARREQDSDKWIRVEFEGITVIVPTDAKRECIADLGIKLMTAANQMKGDKVDAKLLAETFAAVAAH